MKLSELSLFSCSKNKKRKNVVENLTFKNLNEKTLTLAHATQVKYDFFQDK